MAYKLAIAQNKGGNHKTTVATCLADAFKHIGMRVLLIDLDSQTNSTSLYNAVTKNDIINRYKALKEDGKITAEQFKELKKKAEDVFEYSILDVIKRECSAEESIQQTQMGDIIASTHDLEEEEHAVFGLDGRETRLRKALKDIENDYNVIIFDTPPNLGTYTKIALATADSVLIPIKAEKFSIDGLEFLLRTLRAYKRDVNENLVVEGVLFSGYDARKNDDKELKENLSMYGEMNDFYTFNTILRTSTDIGKVQKKSDGENKSLFDNYPRSDLSKDYVALTKELIGRWKER